MRYRDDVLNVGQERVELFNTIVLVRLIKV